MKDLILSIVTKLLLSMLLTLWILATLVFFITVIGMIIIVSNEWWDIGIKLTNGLLK